MNYRLFSIKKFLFLIAVAIFLIFSFGIIYQNFSNDPFGIEEVYPTKADGRVWYANWNNDVFRELHSGERDPSDELLIMIGDGKVIIDGMGIATFRGPAPRLYLYDIAQEKLWDNVEMTFYGKRINETEALSYQGFVGGVKTNHHDATEQKICDVGGYLGRMLYDGKVNFLKEIVHHNAYSLEKPYEENYIWDEKGTMPTNVWIGYKYIVRTETETGFVKLELYRDMTDGVDGGIWELIANYTDDGSWTQYYGEFDIEKTCGYSAGKIWREAGHSVFIRNDGIDEAKYKKWSVREIDPKYDR